MYLNKIISDRIEQLVILESSIPKINLLYGICRFWCYWLTDKEKSRFGYKVFLETVFFDDINFQLFCDKLNIKTEDFPINLRERLCKILKNTEYSNLYWAVIKRKSEHNSYLNYHVIEEFEKSPEHAEYCCLCPAEFHRQFFAELKSYQDLLSPGRLLAAKKIVEEYPDISNIEKYLREFFEDYKKTHYETANRYLSGDFAAIINIATKVLNRSLIKY